MTRLPFPFISHLFPFLSFPFPSPFLPLFSLSFPFSFLPFSFTPFPFPSPSFRIIYSSIYLLPFLSPSYLILYQSFPQFLSIHPSIHPSLLLLNTTPSHHKTSRSPDLAQSPPERRGVHPQSRCTVQGFFYQLLVCLFVCLSICLSTCLLLLVDVRSWIDKLMRGGLGT